MTLDDIFNKARELIGLCNITSLPINPFKIADFLGIPVHTYAEAMEYDFYNQINILRDIHADAFCYKSSTDKYIIFFDETVSSSNRINFTIAHELGHIYLGHHKNTGIIPRYTTTTKRTPIEREADRFAGELLRPPILLSMLNIIDHLDIANICNISSEAAMIGKDLIMRLRNHPYSRGYRNGVNFYSKQFFNFIYKKYCPNCQCQIIIPNPHYCPICGNKNLFFGERDDNMIYPSITIKKCFKCDNEEIGSNANFCKICGSYILNMCSDTICRTAADSNARFCIKCGKPTVYSQRQYFNNWQKEKSDNALNDILPDEEIPF